MTPFSHGIGQIDVNLDGYIFLMQNDSSAFFLSEQVYCWQDAQDEFASIGGHLATFSSLEENIQVWESCIQATTFSPTHWIGLIQISNQDEPNGNWNWITGEELTFENWSASEPNNSGGIEDFGLFSGYGLGSWNDGTNCGTQQRAILELPHTFGCTNDAACNFNQTATANDGSCEFSSCFCLTGTLWDENLGGCVPNPTICSEGTYWDEETQSCLPDQTCPQDLNYDGIVGTDDLLALLSTFGFPCQPEIVEWACGEPVTYHGYDYQTVLIGEQCWFAENLRTEQYQNGDAISLAQTDSSWSEMGEVGAYTWPSHDNATEDLFGKLYNGWVVVDPRGVCPIEWEVPSSFQLTLLMNNFPDFESAGDALKDDDWWNGSNSSGFSARPAGAQSYFGAGFYVGFGNGARMWGTSNGPSLPHLHFSPSHAQIDGNWDNNYGMSIRCIKD